MSGWNLLAVEALESRQLLSAGDLDRAFGNDGVLFLGDVDRSELAVQKDGGILVASGSKVLRFKPDGARDKAFGDGGAADAGFDVGGLELQPDGRIVVGGDSENKWAVVRFDRNGELDRSFAGDGRASLGAHEQGALNVTDLVVQRDGKIVVLGNWEPADRDERYSAVLHARFNPDGTPDAGFAEDGQTRPVVGSYTDHGTLTVDRDGNIVSAGDWYSGGHSFEPSYSVLDPTGSRAGPRTFGKTWAMSSYGTYVDSTTRPDGTVVLAMGARFSEPVASINLDAKRIPLDLHPEWSDNFESIRAVASTPDNKVIVAGEAGKALMQPDPSNGDFLAEPNVVTVMRLRPDGTPDPTFGFGGRAWTNLGDHAREMITAVDVAPDGDIVALGFVIENGGPRSARRFFLARFDGGTRAPGTQRPRATLRRPGDTPVRPKRGARKLVVEVLYSAEKRIAYSSLDDLDVVVRGPNGFKANAVFKDFTNTAGGRLVEYVFAAPGKRWDAADNGTYRISIRRDQVRDNFGNFVEPATIGKFKIQI